MKKVYLTLFLILIAPSLWAESPATDDPLQQSAERGSADAQMELASYYELGYGRPKDPVKALAWYMLAAAQGHALADKRAVLLESRLSRSEIEAAQKLSEQWAKRKPRTPTTTTQ